MGMTITEKNMARHAGLDVVKPGQIIECQLDAVLMNDITFPPARKEFLKIGKPVFDRHKIYLVPDHFTPNKDIQSAISYVNMVLQITLKSVEWVSSTLFYQKKALSVLGK